MTNPVGRPRKLKMDKVGRRTFDVAPGMVLVGRLEDETSGVQLLVYRPPSAGLVDVLASLTRFKMGSKYTYGQGPIPVPAGFRGGDDGPRQP